MPTPLIDAVYPERRFFGFTRCDGTTHFMLRVHALLRPGDVVLDVGCGRGQGADDPCEFRRQLRQLGTQQRTVIGIDVNAGAAENPFIHEFRQIEDSHHWPVADASIDVMISDYVLEHVPEPAAFFSEARRVLKPGGGIALRAPNFYGYGALISWLVPNRYHARLVSRAKSHCKEIDVFPTLYRCNTGRKLLKSMRKIGLDAVVYAIEGEPSYLELFPLAYRLAAAIHPFLPPVFRSTLLAFGRKLPTS